MTTLTITQPDDILAELEKAFADIPFENSAFQNRAFVMAQQGTPARAYRAIGLRMFSKLRALKELQFGRRREEIDLAELREKIADPDTSTFDKRRAEIDMEEKIDARTWTDKLANDALAELNTLYAEFQKFPTYTRESFEAEELAHFKQRLTRAAQIGEGAIGSLAAMHDLAQFDNLLQLTGEQDHVRITQ